MTNIQAIRPAFKLELLSGAQLADIEAEWVSVRVFWRGNAQVITAAQALQQVGLLARI